MVQNNFFVKSAFFEVLELPAVPHEHPVRIQLEDPFKQAFKLCLIAGAHDMGKCSEYFTSALPQGIQIPVENILPELSRGQDFCPETDPGKCRLVRGCNISCCS